MHTAILWACAIVAVIVFGVMVHSIATFRGGPGPAPAGFRLAILREVIWALVPIAIFIGAALPAVRIVGVAADVSVAKAVE